MSQTINIQDSVTIVPSNYTGLTSLTTTTSYPVSNGYTDSSSTTYARLSLSTSTTGYIYYTFPEPDIPSGATIDSITCSVCARVSSTSRVTNTSAQLYTGTTAKGSSSTFASTSTTNTFSLTTGTWTLSELSDIRLRIAGTGSSSSQSKYIYFYGADITITYSINGIQYTLTATSEVTEATVSPLASTKLGGEEETFTITLDGVNLEDITVTDNEVDITSQLVQHQAGGTDSISAVPGSNVTTGFSDSGGAFYQSSSTTSDAWLRYAIGYSAENPYSTTNTSNTYVKGSSSDNTSTGWMNYPFDFSDIPAGATIDSVSVVCYGARENSTIDTTHVCHVGLYSGSTLKSTQQNFTSTTNGTITITSPGTWTRAELQDAQLRFTVGYYGGRLLGVTWTVTYTVQSDGYYYTYTLTNIADDHEIIVTQAGAFVPPEEDPEYTYYPITISSINATTTPHNGTTRVQEGTNQIVTISPTDPQLTLALDNGVDITSQLVGGAPDNSYTVATASGASYGFTLNGSGYYESTNQGIASSAAVARVTFNLETDCTVTFSYINYAESTYDYGIFGNIDTALGTTYSADSGAYLSCSTSTYNTSSVQTVTYTMSAGTHYIDVKYRKDTSTDSNNDSLQFKVALEATSAGGDYTYTLTNIQERHSLIFIFGDVNYYFITSSGTRSKLFPDGQIVVLEGHDYHITIVPNDPDATVTLTDNGTNVTSQLEFEEGTDKSGNRVVNYIYKLNDVNATHSLVATCTSGEGGSTIYLKLNGTWTACSKVYKKVNGSWIEQAESTWDSLFDTRTNYRKMN